VGPEEPGGVYVQGNFGSAREVATDSRRTLVAMNLTNHTVAWRRLLDSRCAGTITTAGGLIFASRYNGELTAMHTDTGQRLWSFQTDGGFTTPVSSFEHEGVQYLTGIAGGGITGGRLNDGLWLFSLNGTIESLPPGSGDPPPEDDDADDSDGDGGLVGANPAWLNNLDRDRVANLARGEEIYTTVCETCHGQTGEGGHLLGAPISDQLDVVDIISTARSGRPGTPMAPFGNNYSLEELQDVAGFIVGEVFPRR
jgi:mono/diheme cytochrome c family protein